MDRKEMEVMAANNKPMPSGLSAHEQLEYRALANIYFAWRSGAITKEQAVAERNEQVRHLRNMMTSREFEAKLWESSARRTMAAERAMAQYRKNRTLEHADELCNRLDWLSEEIARPIEPSEYGGHCPACHKFFCEEHAARKPKYCEDCGCLLKW